MDTPDEQFGEHGIRGDMGPQDMLRCTREVMQGTTEVVMQGTREVM